MIVDGHIHPIPGIVNEETLIREMDKAGVSKAFLIALDVHSSDLDSIEISGKVFNRLMEACIWDVRVIEEMKRILNSARIENIYVAELVKNNPKRFIGIGSINPARGKSYIESKIREIDKLELLGVKFIPTLQFFNPIKVKKNIQKILKYCRDSGKIAIFHTGCDPYVWEHPHISEDGNPKYLEKVIEKFQEVPTIIAHMGSYSRNYPGIWFKEALQLGVRCSNVLFDISAVPYLVCRRGYVEEIRRYIGFHRVLFGSDYPVVGANIASIISEVCNTPYLSEKEKRLVLGLNAVNLIKIF